MNFSPDFELLTINIRHGLSTIRGHFGLWYVFLCNINIVKPFCISLLYFFCFITFTLFYFVHYLFPYSTYYLSVESIDCILLLLLALDAILLNSSVNTLCFSLLNLCCHFNINILFLWILYDFLKCYPHQVYFLLNFSILFLTWVASKQYSNLSFLFMAHFFAPAAFLFSSPSSIK